MSRAHSRFARKSLWALLAIAALAILLFSSRFSAFARHTRPQDDLRKGVTSHGQRVADFRMPKRSRHAVFMDDKPLEKRLYGTRIEADSYVGTVASYPFILADHVLYVPVVGYPSSEGNALILEVDSGSGSVQRVRYDGPNPGEVVRLWKVDTSAWRGHSARLILEDGLDGFRGWLGIGDPRASSHADLAQALRRPSSYAWFALALLIVTVLLFTPGMVAARLWPRSIWAEAELYPVAGFLCLATCGWLIWFTNSGASHFLASAYVTLMIGGLAWLFFHKRRVAAEQASAGGAELLVWGLVALTAVARGLNPLPVVQEDNKYTALPGRAIASPPEQAVTYDAAVYIWHGKAGKADERAYFFDGTMTSRGLLSSFATAALFNIFGEAPTDPPQLSDDGWPVSSDGAYLARILAWLSNAFVVLGAARLMRSLRMPVELRSAALAWLAIAPNTVINTVVLPPTLLAAAFIMFACADLVVAARVRAGVWAALACLSDPVGGYFLPILTCLAGDLSVRQGSEHLRGLATLRKIAASAATFLLSAGICIGPWLLLKRSLEDPAQWIVVPLVHGSHAAAAQSPAVAARATWEALVPLSSYFADRARGSSEGMNAAILWTVQYAKTLPGMLGFSAFWLAYASWFKRGADTLVVAHRRYLIFGSLVLLACWGFSDGPAQSWLAALVAPIIVIALAASPGLSHKLPAVLAITWLEGRWVDLSSNLAAGDVKLSQVPRASWCFWLLGGAATLPLLVPRLKRLTVKVAQPPGRAPHSDQLQTTEHLEQP